MSDTVVAMVAYHRAGPWVRRCVESVLSQTYGDLRCYVVNDADDETPPWPLLADITDRRLVRYDMPENRGRYFLDAVVLEADADAGFWALCDPDDWFEPDRFAELVPLAAETGLAQAPHLLYPGSFDRRPSLRRTRLAARPRKAFEYHAGYASAVTTTQRAREAGGIHPGMRITFDTYFTLACKLAGPFSAHERPFTHKLRRPGSLVTSPDTTFGSPARVAARARVTRLWRRAWRRSQAGLEIASVVHDDAPPEVWDEVRHHAGRLRERIP